MPKSAKAKRTSTQNLLNFRKSRKSTVEDVPDEEPPQFTDRLDHQDMQMDIIDDQGQEISDGEYDEDMLAE
ncbi:hypothetical protein C0993_007153, partial [Termitomyces sp. T159_Od127]